MGYRREHIPTIIRTLRAARPQSMRYGVCSAIEIARGKELISIQDLITTKSFIRQVLGDNTWLTGWMRTHGVHIEWSHLTKTRRRWIDKMIQDLQRYATGATP